MTFYCHTLGTISTNNEVICCILMYLWTHVFIGESDKSKFNNIICLAWKRLFEAWLKPIWVQVIYSYLMAENYTLITIVRKFKDRP